MVIRILIEVGLLQYLYGDQYEETNKSHTTKNKQITYFLILYEA